ncbi:NADPH-dependent FMN reductase [Demequina salsinemoris]|uniref:NADPH-dependent FMN reductase n=1 Tax=Demequina salsinemoris TaxID=577470 RepID=UPI00078262ED|nr:NAD(P)H-dependent oxidoreductase [Demequina salsinemoris]
MKIGIIVGSIREGRRGRGVGQWVLAHAANRPDADYELIDLKEHDVPLFTSSVSPAVAGRAYEDPAVQRWSAAIDACDAFIFVTPEYNHGVPGAFKNAVDSLGPEWRNKPVAFVSYGADGGVRAVEQWRQIVANFQMFGIRSAIALGMFTDFAGDGSVAAIDRRAAEAETMLSDLETAVARLAAPAADALVG